MKLAMFSTPQNTLKRPGLVICDHGATWMIDIHACIATYPGTLLEAIKANRIAELKACVNHPAAVHYPIEDCKIAAPIHRPGKIICVGLNYRDHALEGGREVPDFPTLFQKAPSAVIGHQDTILLPACSSRVDFEAELAVVIGKTTKSITSDAAMENVAGYTILNDVSARDLQRRTSQWTFGKSCDTFAPLGPWLVTPDSIPNPVHLEIQSFLNGHEMQHSNTKQLIFSIPDLIAEISSVITLEPGDVISTGTPAGVGDFRTPPIYLTDGDRIEISIEGIGTLSNPIQQE